MQNGEGQAHPTWHPTHPEEDPHVASNPLSHHDYSGGSSGNNQGPRSITVPSPGENVRHPDHSLRHPGPNIDSGDGITRRSPAQDASTAKHTHNPNPAALWGKRKSKRQHYVTQCDNRGKCDIYPVQGTNPTGFPDPSTGSHETNARLTPVEVHPAPGGHDKRSPAEDASTAKHTHNPNPAALWGKAKSKRDGDDDDDDEVCGLTGCDDGDSVGLAGDLGKTNKRQTQAGNSASPASTDVPPQSSESDDLNPTCEADPAACHQTYCTNDANGVVTCTVGWKVVPTDQATGVPAQRRDIKPRNARKHNDEGKEEEGAASPAKVKRSDDPSPDETMEEDEGPDLSSELYIDKRQVKPRNAKKHNDEGKEEEVSGAAFAARSKRFNDDDEDDYCKQTNPTPPGCEDPDPSSEIQIDARQVKPRNAKKHNDEGKEEEVSGAAFAAKTKRSDEDNDAKEEEVSGAAFAAKTKRSDDDNDDNDSTAFSTAMNSKRSDSFRAESRSR